jgi:hypothetical protein
MKHSSYILLGVLLFLMPAAIFAQAIFSEDFNYSEGTRLVGVNGWEMRYGGTEMTVGSVGLSFNGYPGSGIGNAVSITGGGTFETPYHFVSVPTSGSIYLSCLVSISGTDANEGAFFVFGNSNAGNYRAVVQTKIVSGSVYFGASATMDVPTYDAAAYAVNTTYLIVLKYTFVDGDNNDEVRLYVLSSDVPSSEPSTPNVGPLMMPNEGFAYGSVIISSGGSVGSPLLGAALLVDGVRVGGSWTQTVLPGPVFYGSTNSISFGTVAMSTTKTDSVKVKNTGTASLNITSVVSGNASYVVSQGDTTIAVGDSVWYYITFAPATTGGIGGSILFYHDAAESPFTTWLYGTGMAAEPTVQTSDIVLSSDKSNAMTVSWTNGNGSKRIVLMKMSGAVDGFPVDEVTYDANAKFGDGAEIGTGNYVVYSGTGNSVTITGLVPSIEYSVAVMEYNGTGGYENYLLLSPLTGTGTTGTTTIWSADNGALTFTKTNYAPFTLPVNQDRITDNVWLTRANSGGLFNIQSEMYSGENSPAGTEWAIGTTADLGSLVFDTWKNTLGGKVGENIVGQDMVMYLVEDDIYLDIIFLSWTAGVYGGGDGGGGFSYIRAAGPLEVTLAGTHYVTSTSATITGKVFSRDAAVTAYFLIGTESGVYTDSVPAVPSLIEAGTLTSVSADLSGLTKSVEYFYTAAASNDTLFGQSDEDAFMAQDFVVRSSSNGTITFTKTSFADWTQPLHQDHITENVWITRADDRGIFNIRSESSNDEFSPAGTEWSYGTTEDISSLVFDTWLNTHNWNPPAMVNKDMVVHLIEDDIYIDIKFLSWTNGRDDGGGGGFSYVRAAGPLEAQTTQATDVKSSTVILHGKVYSMESAATAYVLHGTSSGVYTDSVIVTPDPIDAGSQTSVSADVSGLVPGIMHYFCIAALNDTYYARSNELNLMTYSSSPGNALKFDGNDDFVEIPYAAELNPAVFTYEFWARVDGGTGTYRSPLSTRFWDWGSSFYGVNFYATEGNVWEFTWGGGADAGHWYGFAGPAVEVGKWTHLAATCDGTHMRFYINGTLRGDTTLAYAPTPYATIPFRFGSIADDLNAFFYGAIDEVRVWNVARSAEEIQNTMNTPFTEGQTNLVGYWQMNEATGTVVRDLAGSNNGSLINFEFDVTDGWISSDNAMPAELVSFTATPKGRGVELAWKTATEVNNYGFDIEKRMKDELGIMNWVKLGFVEGRGTTNAPQSYSFIDNSASGTVAYRLKQIDRDGSFEYSNQVEVTVAAPVEFALMQNHPNPFNPSTSIRYQVAAPGHVSLKVYDILGKEVATLVNGMQDAGAKIAKLDASQLPSGIYFYTLRTSNFTATKKMLLLK